MLKHDFCLPLAGAGGVWSLAQPAELMGKLFQVPTEYRVVLCQAFFALDPSEFPSNGGHMSLTPVQLTNRLLGRHCLVGGTALCRVFFFSTAITTTQHLSKYGPAHVFGLIASTLNLADGLGVGATLLQRIVCLAGGSRQ